jgi:hypothetical protein
LPSDLQPNDRRVLTDVAQCLPIADLLHHSLQTSGTATIVDSYGTVAGPDGGGIDREGLFRKIFPMRLKSIAMLMAHRANNEFISKLFQPKKTSCELIEDSTINSPALTVSSAMLYEGSV